MKKKIEHKSVAYDYSEFNNYCSNISLILNDIISVKNNQNTVLSNINNTLPSFLQSSTAAGIYQPLGDYLTVPNFNSTIQDYTTIVMVNNKVSNYLLNDNFNTFSLYWTAIIKSTGL